MTRQLVFLISLLITLGAFGYTVSRYTGWFRVTRKTRPVRDLRGRLLITLKVALGQTKILRRPGIGLLHAFVFWGFCVILIGSVEMVVDGLAGTGRVFHAWGIVYDVIVAGGDVFAVLVALAVIVFLARRLFLRVRRFRGTEMKHVSHLDAGIALGLILLLMITLLGTNAYYINESLQDGYEPHGFFPVSSWLAPLLSFPDGDTNRFLHELNWWSHILLVFIFANYLPYSKHFHVFMSVPNVFLSRLEPLGKLDTMESITREVRIMMDDPLTVTAAPGEGEEEGTVERFGILDVEDVSWKNYLDSLACTECGRCTAACPANLTGKKLSPRKIIMDVRSRMKEKGPGLVRHGRQYNDNRSLVGDYITGEELWACTLCNACALECPVNINHPGLIVNMRRYLVMEESAAPAELNAIFTNIENNGAPWQFSRDDRMLWAGDLQVPLMAEAAGRGQQPEYLLWVGSAGSFDDRCKKITRSFIKILDYLGTSYAVLGTEESSSGDVARRAGNEMLFQMQALMNIELLGGYGVRKILTCDPHAYNTFKNEYPDLGGSYEVIHHSQFISAMIGQGRLDIRRGDMLARGITFHDPCYLGRANGEYNAPRIILEALSAPIREMKRNRSFALCCGAGGGQMFKEAEQGDREVFIERTEEALGTGAGIIATACPYCMVMMTDGLKYKNREHEVHVYDIAELAASALNL